MNNLKMKFAIRDDDTSFWTSPEELEKPYKEIWSGGIPVSLAVIPYAVKSHTSWNRELFYQEEEQVEIGKNPEIVSFLKEKIKTNKISILLHGFSHQYKVSESPYGASVPATRENLDRLCKHKKGSELLWHGEYTWKNYEQLKSETKKGKEYLEDLFQTKITIFVPPSNDISRAGVRAVAYNRLHISGTMYLSKFNRPVNFYSMKNYLLKLWWQAKFHRVFPHVMNYRNHKELPAHSLVPGITLKNLQDSLMFCHKKNAPFVLATHYWEINNTKEMQNILRETLKFAGSLNVDFSMAENCYI